MKLNEVRLPIRILAGIFAVPMWPIALFLGVGWLFDPFDMKGFTSFLGAIALTLLFSFSAVKGVVPAFIMNLFSHGSVGGKDDFK